MKLYFAYGANLSLDSMAVRCPKARPFQTFYLSGWELGFATHATIRPNPGKVVPGALWRITDDCEWSLDAFEGYPKYYTKRILGQDGYEFMVYVMNNPDYGNTYESYIDLIELGYDDWQLDKEPLWTAVDKLQSPVYNEMALT
jgi:gamma-glutamylcyclotransferase (GGCT)/AIG2-like uncharacterized protein YtfP